MSASGLSHHTPGRQAALPLVMLAEDLSGHAAQITRRCLGNAAEMGWARSEGSLTWWL